MAAGLGLSDGPGTGVETDGVEGSSAAQHRTAQTRLVFLLAGSLAVPRPLCPPPCRSLRPTYDASVSFSQCNPALFGPDPSLSLSLPSSLCVSCSRVLPRKPLSFTGSSGEPLAERNIRGKRGNGDRCRRENPGRGTRERARLNIYLNGSRF